MFDIKKTGRNNAWTFSLHNMICISACAQQCALWAGMAIPGGKKQGLSLQCITCAFESVSAVPIDNDTGRWRFRHWEGKKISKEQFPTSGKSQIPNSIYRRRKGLPGGFGVRVGVGSYGYWKLFSGNSLILEIVFLEIP